MGQCEAKIQGLNCFYLQGMGWRKGGGVIMVTAIKLCCTWEYFQFVWNEGDVQDDMMN